MRSLPGQGLLKVDSRASTFISFSKIAVRSVWEILACNPCTSHICVHTYVCTYVRAYVRTYIQIYIYTRTCTERDAHICICIYTYDICMCEALVSDFQSPRSWEVSYLRLTPSSTHRRREPSLTPERSGIKVTGVHGFPNYPPLYYPQGSVLIMLI